MRGEKRDQLRESGEKNQHKVTKKKKNHTHTERRGQEEECAGVCTGDRAGQREVRKRQLRACTAEEEEESGQRQP